MSEPTYYHGGPDGRRVGSWLLPASITGARTFGPEVAAEMGCPEVVRVDRCYLTTEYNAALIFASAFRRPMIYIAVPDGEVEHDPDWKGERGVSVMCVRAQVVRRLPPRPSDIEMVRRSLFDPSPSPGSAR